MDTAPPPRAETAAPAAKPRDTNQSRYGDQTELPLSDADMQDTSSNAHSIKSSLDISEHSDTSLATPEPSLDTDDGAEPPATPAGREKFYKTCSKAVFRSAKQQDTWRSTGRDPAECRTTCANYAAVTPPAPQLVG